jgi:hypothetical protein
MVTPRQRAILREAIRNEGRLRVPLSQISEPALTALIWQGLLRPADAPSTDLLAIEYELTAPCSAMRRTQRAWPAKTLEPFSLPWIHAPESTPPAVRKAQRPARAPRR